MEYKKWLIEGFCPVDRYTCLMPVEYESEEEGGKIVRYHKKRMVCRHAVAGECENVEKCTFWEKAPEILDKSSNWYEG